MIFTSAKPTQKNDSVDDDTIMECLLTVEASVFYNAKNNVLSVKEKDN